MSRAWMTPAQAKDALEHGRGNGVKIAIIDSGVEAAHPSFGALALVDDIAIVQQDDGLVIEEGGGRDAFGHGTAVAWSALQTAPEARIGSFRVLDGRNLSKSHAVCRAALLAIERGYHIINCSIGAGIKEQVLMYKDWVDRAYLAGVHVVAACNNLDFRRLEWPGHFSSVITVNMLAAPREDRLYRNQGVSLVEFAAHGVNVRVPWKGGIIIETTGSSFAAPRAAGMLARLLSSRPDLRPLEAKALLQVVAEPWPESQRQNN
ncbi:MAG: S8 family serine peptidase [Verrucomicrobiaceae bacterium]|nr:S8 family serine peptidase [Verrucomicrobiaceae bacterium]